MLSKPPGPTNIPLSEEPLVPENIIYKRQNIIFERKELLGQGGYAKCYKVKNKYTDEVYCCKILFKSRIKSNRDKNRIRNEVLIHRRLEHKNIVKMFCAFEDTDFLYIILELCENQTLKELIKKRKTLTESEIRYYLLQLFDAIEYLRMNKIIHRDIKLANIFLSGDLTIRLGDFGLATEMIDDQDRKTSMCGTPNYLAPEMVSRKGHGYEIDVWAVGIVMYTLFYGITPFHSKLGLGEVYNNIKNLKINFPGNAYATEEFKDAIRFILNPSPTKRPTVTSLRRHPFFLGFVPDFLPVDSLTTIPDLQTNLKYPSKRNRLEALEGKQDTRTISKYFKYEKPISPDIEHSICRAYSKLDITPTKETIVGESVQFNSGIITKIKTRRRDITSLFLSTYTHALKLLDSGISSDEIHQIIGHADLKIPNFISKWMDNGKEYGFGYIFIDKTAGYLFKDSSSISSPDLNYFEYSAPSSSTVLCFEEAACPPFLIKKLRLFKNYISDIDKRLMGAIFFDAQPSLPEFKFYYNPEVTNMSGSHTQLPYLTKKTLTKFARIFSLSSGIIQLNLLKYHSKYIISDMGRAIFRISSDRKTVRSYTLVDLLVAQKSPHLLKEKKAELQQTIMCIAYIKDVFTYFENKNSTQ